MSLLVLYCHDPDATARFYEPFGIRFDREQHGQGPPHRAAVLASGVVLELYPARHGEVTSVLRLGLEVPQGEAALAAGKHVLVDPDGRTAVIEVIPEQGAY